MDGRSGFVLAIGLLVPTAVAAHLPPGATGPLGEHVQILGPYHGELVAQDGQFAPFLFDHRGSPLDARQTSGTALVILGGQQRGLVVAPRADGPPLVAIGDFSAAPGLRVVVNVILAPGASQARARFTPAGLPQ